MGLLMTLQKDKNHMATEFANAYWSITDLGYDIETLHFRLDCVPSREAKLLAGTQIENRTVNGFGICQSIYRPELYSWSPTFNIAEVFPDGIPLGRDAQLTQIYNFIKSYTGLPFEDVFEDAAAEVEPAHEEPAVEPEPSDPTENVPEETVIEPEPEQEDDPIVEDEEPEEEPVAAAEPEPTPEPEPTHNPLSL